MRTTLLATSALLASPAFAVDVIVNEWNAVNDTKWLNSADTAACTGPAGISCATDQDNFFGRIMGNGSDWIELVVVNDHVDMRGWRLQWVAGVGVAAADAPPVGNGNDIWWGDGSAAQGEIVLSQAAVWSDVRAGTIITLIQNTAAQGGLDTDLSFDPCRGDWWINVNINDAALCEPVSNVAAELAVGRRLHVSEDNFWVRIVDDEGNEHIGLIGENSFGWPASGVNSREVGKLEADPTPTISIYSNYQDANHSTFGSPNRWSVDTGPDVGCTRVQNMDPLRTAVRAELCESCNALALNEYNAVSSTAFLGGGTATGDANVPPGFASDAQFGRVAGNGGNWFELVIIQDGLDMRGWTLRWSETGASGTITLSNAAAWSDMRTGTILTFIEKTTAQGGLNTDLSYNPSAGDRWINVNTFDASMVQQTTSTKPGHVSGAFTTSNDRWSIEVLDGSGAVAMGRQGEGAIGYNGGNVNAEDVCRLRVDPGAKVDGTSRFDDAGAASTFGRANEWAACPGGAAVTQSFAALLASGCEAPASNPADLNGDGVVSGADLGLLLGAWGLPGPADLNGDGTVSGADLGLLLGVWG
jgi:hypothetical protein